jgi:hypothetical protein
LWRYVLKQPLLFKFAFKPLFCIKGYGKPKILKSKKSPKKIVNEPHYP